jgi:hypothetical protein
MTCTSLLSPNARLTIRAPIAAISAPGILFETILRPTMATSTLNAIANS